MHNPKETPFKLYTKVTHDAQESFLLIKCKTKWSDIIKYYKAYNGRIFIILLRANFLF